MPGACLVTLPRRRKFFSDLRREEFKEAIGRALAGGGDEGVDVVGNGDKLVHGFKHAYPDA
jgi:hypothetical protein